MFVIYAGKINCSRNFYMVIRKYVKENKKGRKRVQRKREENKRPNVKHIVNKYKEKELTLAYVSHVQRSNGFLCKTVAFFHIYDTMKLKFIYVKRRRETIHA
ncbi:hypothetical protein JS44_05585 [Anoxybacillus flavithermus]|uniref:Uncharacterized protein n=1 Tax=Anoxybacillus flavithermus TaxID=33934 RepID=A0A094IZF3_9BACL|nr:hypothetical protein JS44_05585 [Anoxybacillus flavithermus]